MLLMAFFLLYIFLVKLHLDGRLLDLYRRMCAPESAFVIPHDMEVAFHCCSTTSHCGTLLASGHGQMHRHADMSVTGCCACIATLCLDDCGCACVL
jgi:hypothetical protein